MKVGIVSLGCSRNLVDSEKILGRIKNKGHEIVSEVEEADTAIVNTCSFIDDAKKESIGAILELIELKKKGSLKKIIVTGCLVKQYKDELVRELKEVDAFTGALNIEDNNLDRHFLSPRHFAYLKISEGCSHSCSFCVIPKIKGKLSSNRINSVLKEARFLDQEHKSEINIIGQDISLYGADLYQKPSLAKLLSKMAKLVKNVRWIRLLYLHPNHISDELIDLIAKELVICKYLDIPIQHINNRLLHRMNRGASKESITALIKKLRVKIPGVAIRTSLIVGFPQETDEEFNELLDFVRSARFERLGVFKYSPQEGTPAYEFSAQVPEGIKEKRRNILMRAQQEVSESINQGFLGEEVEVLIDEESGGGDYVGRRSVDAPEVDGVVYVKSARPLKPGEFVKVKIIDTYEYDLVGEVLGSVIAKSRRRRTKQSEK